jgi:uncharacterized protein
MTETTAAVIPTIVPYLKRDPSGRPFLQGTRCQTCETVYVGERAICAKCYARKEMMPVKLAERGKLYAFTVVHRSFPGVDTPFIDVIVDLDDGAHIKGILRDVEPLPERLRFDMPLEIVYREVTPPGATEKYLAYYFVPARSNA